MIKSRIDTIEIQSRTLGKTMAATIYVPTNFCEGLPVLYFMHGRSGDESIIHALDIQTVADRMIADGRMKPMLIGLSPTPPRPSVQAHNVKPAMSKLIETDMNFVFIL